MSVIGITKLYGAKCLMQLFQSLILSQSSTRKIYYDITNRDSGEAVVARY